MKTKGRIKTVARDTMTGKYLVQLETDSRVLVGLDEVKDTDIDIIIHKHREARSLDQNALYWVYVTEIAHAIGRSIAYTHNHFIAHYGYPFFVSGKIAMVVLPDDNPDEIMESETFHVKPTSQVKKGRDGTMYRTYIVMRGSSTYNTQEMSRLIDGAEREAQNLGIHLEEHYYR